MQHQLLTNQAPPPMGVQYPSIGVGNLGRYIQVSAPHHPSDLRYMSGYYRACSE